MPRPLKLLHAARFAAGESRRHQIALASKQAVVVWVEDEATSVCIEHAWVQQRVRGCGRGCVSGSGSGSGGAGKVEWSSTDWGMTVFFDKELKKVAAVVSRQLWLIPSRMRPRFGSNPSGLVYRACRRSRPVAQVQTK